MQPQTRAFEWAIVGPDQISIKKIIPKTKLIWPKMGTPHTPPPLKRYINFTPIMTMILFQLLPHPLWHPPLTPDWRPDSPTSVCDVVWREDAPRDGAEILYV